jgi:type IV secretory pathway ATPase VirB11/archaellum biosynthesis ATPase
MRGLSSIARISSFHKFTGSSPAISKGEVSVTFLLDLALRRRHEEILDRLMMLG